MRAWTKPASTLLLGLCLWGVGFYVYLSNLPVNQTYDGLVFASLIEKARVPFYSLFHPHHLIYTFLGRIFFEWGRDHGALWDGLTALRFMDILTGTAGLFLAFHLLVRITDDRLVAFLTALGLAFTYSYWYFSTSAGVRILATVTPLLAWYVLSYQAKKPPAFGILVGLSHALAVLGHQTNLLLAPAFLGGILLLREKTWMERLKTSLYYLLSLTAGVLAAYGFVGRFLLGETTYARWVWWMMSYMHVKEWGGHLESAGFERSKVAMVFAFLAGADPSKPMTAYFTYGWAKDFLLNSVLTLTAFLLLGLRFLWRKYTQALWVAFFWLLAFVPFFIWWEPWNIEFWVSSTVPCWVLMGIAVSDLSRHFVNPILKFSNRWLVVGLWACLILLLFFYNFETRARVGATVHPHQQLLNALDWKVRRDDLLVLTGINTIPLTLDRYQKRSYLSLHAFLKKYREPEPEKGKHPSPKTKPVFNSDAWADLDAVFQQVWERHRKVWVLLEVVDEGGTWTPHLEKMLKCPDGQIRSFFSRYELDPVTYGGKVHFYEVKQPSPPSGGSSE